jgi:hypothetical protein
MHRRPYFQEDGGVIAQAVSRLFPPAGALVQFQVRSCHVGCGGQSDNAAGFLPVLRSP